MSLRYAIDISRFFARGTTVRTRTSVCVMPSYDLRRWSRTKGERCVCSGPTKKKEHWTTVKADIYGSPAVQYSTCVVPRGKEEEGEGRFKKKRRRGLLHARAVWEKTVLWVWGNAYTGQEEACPADF